MRPFEVVIGGSGPAAIEAALVLRRLARGLVETTLVTPDEECVHLPMTVATPFARSGSTRYPLADLASDARASLRRGTITSVDAEARTVRIDEGATAAYDADTARSPGHGVRREMAGPTGRPALDQDPGWRALTPPHPHR
jgi:NADH dehydrogenase FAD-containing subunit